MNKCGRSYRERAGSEKAAGANPSPRRRPANWKRIGNGPGIRCAATGNRGRSAPARGLEPLTR
jgi:hypothetical protein